jgi:hypothetical protein
VIRLLKDLGDACVAFHSDPVRNIDAKRVQIDKIWQFVYAKARNVPEDKHATFGFGDVWTWAAIDADGKLIISYLVAPRQPQRVFALSKTLPNV